MECMIEIENLSLTMKKQIILSDINLTLKKENSWIDWAEWLW